MGAIQSFYFYLDGWMEWTRAGGKRLRSFEDLLLFVVDLILGSSQGIATCY